MAGEAACVLTIVTLGATSVPAGADPAYVSAKTLLTKLSVRAEDHKHRYVRERFGYDDSYDADGDGCYTRKEVLIRDAIRIDRVSKSCAVYGRWKSLYDDRVTDSPYDLQVDHLVPLAEAWHSGAYAWSKQKQVAFGNDIGYKWDLQAVTSDVNQGKRAGDPAVWLPPKNRCTYVKAWIGVKFRWQLPVDAAEKAALTRELRKCNSLQVLKPGKPDLTALTGY